MGVPEEVRKVPRPIGTVVMDSRKGIYAVREKLYMEPYQDESGRWHRPSRNGKVVGHIIDGRYVPKEEDGSVSVGRVDVKAWGEYELCDRLNRDILVDLLVHYNDEDATRLYVMAMLRALNRNLSDRLMQRAYEESFLTEMYPGVNLKRTSVSTFLRNVGRTASRMTAFMRDRVKCVIDSEHLIIDGTLKQDHSRVNSMSAVSRKTRFLRYRQVMIMYAYNLEGREPVCMKTYPGNVVDSRAVDDFLEEFQITRGIIVADKGFSPAAVSSVTSRHEDLHYIIPIKRNDSVIGELSLDITEKILKDVRGVTYSKVESSRDGAPVWYYAFRDPMIAAEEEILYLSNELDATDFDPEELATRRFGMIFFESDCDLDPGTVYFTYEDRWTIELMFRFEKDVLEMDDTREHSEYTLMASNFVDYLAALMTSRMLAFFRRNRLLEKSTYGDVMARIGRFMMTDVDGSGEWKVSRAALTDAEFMERIGLLRRPIVPTTPKKRGRPKGSKDTKPRKRRSKTAETAGGAPQS